MTPSRDLETTAFRSLRSHLARRRLAQIDLRLRVELFLLGFLLAGFILWQARGTFASLHRQGGPPLVVAALLVTGFAMALLAAGFVAARHRARLRGGPHGPAWMALPIEPRTLARHLEWDSSMIAWWLVFPALGVWAAAVGLVPMVGLLAVAPLLAGALVGATAVGAGLGGRLAAVGRRGRPELPAVHRVLATAAPVARHPRLPVAEWTRRPATLAFMVKDARLTRRVPNVGGQFLVAIACWALSVLAWRLPHPSSGPPLDYAVAFFMALLGSAALGEWLVLVSGSDPFAVVRVLPVGLRHVWGARFGLALAATAALLGTHLLGSFELTRASQRVFLAWIGGATLAIGMLAVNYGVTLFPRADVAQRLLGLSLGLAVATSLMIPLLGWIVLLSAVIHSARRLPHWSRLEET